MEQNAAETNRKDPAWKYNYLKDPKDTNTVTCSFCGKTTKGGIFRAKQHQVGKHKNAAACKQCPDDVKEELENYIREKKSQRMESYGILPNFDDENIGDDDCEEDEVQEIFMMGSNKKQKLVAQPKKGPLDLFMIKKPAMGYIYEAMDRAKETIIKSFDRKEDKYKEVFEIIDRRWECQLHHPLHAAGHFLNPEFFYGNPSVEHDEEVTNGLYKTIERLVPDIALQDKIMNELSSYKKADGQFGNLMAIKL